MKKTLSIKEKYREIRVNFYQIVKEKIFFMSSLKNNNKNNKIWCAITTRLSLFTNLNFNLSAASFS